jgi:hypothetical protein
MDGESSRWTRRAARPFNYSKASIWVSRGHQSSFTRLKMNESQETAKLTRAAVGIHVLLTRSLFGEGILRSFPLRAWPAKSTSASVRC